MKNELKLRRCLKCGAIVKEMESCKCEIMCCGEAMQEVKANSTDAAFEKHVPTYEIDGDYIKVKVNHVMEEEHYIEWICLKSDNREEYVYFKPNEEAVAVFKKCDAGVIYSYCNKHGLWSADI